MARKEACWSCYQEYECISTLPWWHRIIDRLIGRSGAFLCSPQCLNDWLDMTWLEAN
jgi:hypothetical protein